MSEKGDTEGKENRVDLGALLTKVEQAEALLAEVSRDLRAVTEPEGAQPASQPAAPVKSSIVEASPVEAVPVKAAPVSPSAEPYRIPVQRLFQLALAPPENIDALEAALGDILHSSAKSSPRAVRMMIRFPWARFMKSWAQYLTNPADPSSFIIERMSPKDLGKALRAKVFVSVAGKHPAPVELERDEGEGSPWEIVSFSL